MKKGKLFNKNNIKENVNLCKEIMYFFPDSSYLIN
jgi:hypothetical protein